MTEQSWGNNNNNNHGCIEDILPPRNNDYDDYDLDDIHDLHDDDSDDDNDDNDNDNRLDQMPSVEAIRSMRYLDDPLSSSTNASWLSYERRKQQRLLYSSTSTSIRKRYKFVIIGFLIVFITLLIIMFVNNTTSDNNINTFNHSKKHQEIITREYLIEHNIISNPNLLEPQNEEEESSSRRQQRRKRRRKGKKNKKSILSSRPTPHYLALKWMIYIDELQLDITINTNEFIQRYLIVLFIYSIITVPTTTTTTTITTNENNFEHTVSVSHQKHQQQQQMLIKLQNQFHFLSKNLHECNWNSKWLRPDGIELTMGIICNNTTTTDDDDDSSSAVVTKIILQTLGLQGTIPLELGLLTSLSTLALDVNKISGDIPIIPSLQHLSMSYNQLQGGVGGSTSLPVVSSSSSSNLKNIQFLQNLITLELSENLLNGYIPSGITALTKLQYLALNGNNFIGNINPIYSLSNLEELYLQYNNLSGGLSNDSFNKQHKLRILDISNNKLVGPLPDQLFQLSHLEVIDLHYNALNGHINTIPQLTKRSTNSLEDDTILYQHPLKYLDISDNFIGGSIPTSIGLLNQLTHLDVSSNRFDDKLPSLYMKYLTNLEVLLLSDNTYFGPEPIPEWLQEMPKLKHLSMKLTGRIGTIPSWFVDLVNLESIDLDWNHIEGTIPSKLNNMLDLKYLLLNRNWLSGTIPNDILQLPQLSMLLVDNNNLNGTMDICTINNNNNNNEQRNEQNNHIIAISDCAIPYSNTDDDLYKTNNYEVSTTPIQAEINCPCCTLCCSDDDQRCNTQDWSKEIEHLWIDHYNDLRKQQPKQDTNNNNNNNNNIELFYHFESNEEYFIPSN